jgi:hypothetical protein
LSFSLAQALRGLADANAAAGIDRVRYEVSTNATPT